MPTNVVSLRESSQLCLGGLALLVHSAAGENSITSPSRGLRDAITDAQTPRRSPERSDRNRRRPHTTCPTSSHRARRRLPQRL